MVSRYLLLTAAGIAVFLSAASQINETGSFRLNESLMESIAGMDEESEDFEAILNELDNLQQHPLDLNIVTPDDLRKLPFLTDFQIESLLAYRKLNGEFLSIYELQVVYGFTSDVINMILPFVMVSDQPQQEKLNVRNASLRANHDLDIRLQRVLHQSKGYSVYDSATGNTYYQGNPWLVNMRYTFESTEHFRAGFTVEKDPGEQLFKASNRNGFDFNSAYVMIRNAGFLKSAVAGDYRLSFGQGLTLWSGAAPGKSSMAMNVAKRQDAIKAFTSNDENNYFRGVAAAAAVGNFTFTAFFSTKKRDGNISDSISPDRSYFTSFQESGYHRTKSEIADEKSVRETIIGGNLLFRNNILKLGSTLVSCQFDKYMLVGNTAADVHDFSGNRLINWGIDYLLTLKRAQFFGETSYGNNHWATINGVLLNVSKHAAFSLLYRNFGAGYFSLHSSAFSEGSSDSNEEGFYAGVIIHPVAKVKISGYVDLYRFPWIKYRVSTPSASGSDYMFQTDYAPGKKVNMYFRFRYESDPVDELPDSLLIPVISDLKRTGLRYHLSYRITQKLTMQDRLEYIISKPGSAEASEGIMVYHDLEYNLKKIPLVFDLRLAWFNTGDFNSRIYAYEHDLTGGYSFSPLYDKGLRTYIMMQYRISEKLTFWLRVSNSWYFNKNSTGSGYDEIDSPARTDLKFKLAFRF